MGIDIHEWRRAHDKSDPNPLVKRVAAKYGPSRRPQAVASFRKTEWWKAKTYERRAKRAEKEALNAQT